MSITITVPNDDHVALRAMAKALEEIAVARGAVPRTQTRGAIDYTLNIDTTQATAAVKELVKQAEVDSTSQQVESLGHAVFSVNGVELNSEPAPDVSITDSTGTPWDERIHSASKALNADGTWRLRRKPASKDVEEWAAEVEQVLTELTQPIQTRESEKDDIDPEHYAAETAEGMNNIPEPSVTLPGDDFHVDAGEVTEQQIAAIPVPPLPPRGSVPSDFDDDIPYAPSDTISPPLERLAGEQSTMSFPDVMKFLTERHARISNEQVTQIITAMGLKSIMDLNTQPEHTGPFIARVKALLGEQ